ncbi:MAG TPA: TlpA disulfide reductase family protein [Bryobacteraceae bacterium]|nr:TlpA disulfide reductase family protein [Bryobacteraceae bacterium]
MLACASLSIALAQQPQAQPSRLLPNILIKTPDAKGINLRKYRGKELILVLFSTECGDCVTTIGYLSKIQTDYGARGLQVIGVGVNRNAPYALEPWRQRYHPTFPMGFLDQEDMLKLVALPQSTVPYVPIVMFVDRAGTVRVQYTGDNPVLKDKQQEKALRAIADSLLKWQGQHVAAKAAVPAKQ